MIDRCLLEDVLLSSNILVYCFIIEKDLWLYIALSFRETGVVLLFNLIAWQYQMSLEMSVISGFCDASEGN